MAFTYDLATNRGKVRFIVPDTDSTAPYLTDVEIDHCLNEAGTVKAAAVMACNWLARRFAQRATFTADGLTVQNSQRAEAFAARAKELMREMQGAMTAVTVDRDDGYHEAAVDDSEYEKRTVYIEV
jgi:hypothetical protein